MSNFSRRKRLNIQDGEYPAVVAFMGHSEQTYALKVEDGLPSLLFPAPPPNYQAIYHVLELQSEWIVRASSEDALPLFRVTKKLPDPYAYLGVNRGLETEFRDLYIALNEACNDQAVLKYGKHLLFATKGRLSWREPLNFLLDYFHLVIGREWIEAQTATSHPLAILMTAVHTSIASSPSDSQGRKHVPVGNLVIGWFLDFAFNLFIVALNQKLEDRSLARLRDPRMFWSTVHEIFVASLFLRKGFEIRLEDEDDRSSRHPEFIAIHKATNAEFAVEAKLANQSIFSETMDFRKWKDPKGFRYRGLLNDAIDKNTSQPLVVVLDFNRLPISDEKDQKHFNNYMYRELLNSISPDNGTRDRWSRIEFVNRPFLLATSRGVSCIFSRFTVQSANSVYAASPIAAVWAMNAVFDQLSVHEEIERLGRHLDQVMTSTQNRFWVLDSRKIAFSPIPPDYTVK